MPQNQINLTELDNMLEDLGEHSWAESTKIWDINFCKRLAHECQKLSDDGQLTRAAIGFNVGRKVQPQIRGDFTSWIDTEKPNETQTEFLHELRQIQNKLNEFFYLGLNSLETHFALYPPGFGYDKHIDNHRNSNARKITFILYLNEFWKIGDGGELSIYAPNDEQKRIAQVTPELARFVLFRSELFPHQVENSHKNRLSVTGWFRNNAL